MARSTSIASLIALLTAILAHAEVPLKPIIQSECCSCNTMRGQEADTTIEGGCETTDDNPHDECLQISFAGRCLENLVNASDGVAWAAGTYVWT